MKGLNNGLKKVVCGNVGEVFWHISDGLSMVSVRGKIWSQVTTSTEPFNRQQHNGHVTELRERAELSGIVPPRFDPRDTEIW